MPQSRADEPFDATDREELATFRYAAAGMIRDLISARMQAEPAWPDAVTRQQWFDRQSTKPANSSPQVLLTAAANNFKRFRQEFCGYLSSELCFEEADESPQAVFQRVRDMVIEFADQDDLIAATKSLRKAKPVDWKGLAKWELLGLIRMLLNKLPEKSPARAKSDDVLSFDDEGQVLFQGAVVGPFTGIQHAVLEFLVVRKSTAVDDFWRRFWDPANDLNRGAIRSLFKRINKVLRSHRVPRMLSISGNRVMYKYRSSGPTSSHQAQRQPLGRTKKVRRK